MKKEIMNITRDNFQKYGEVIEVRGRNLVDGEFKIIVEEPDSGWRIATYHIFRKSTGVFERHIHSKESFEPLYGISLLLVAPAKTPEIYEVFLLDCPVCLEKGIWHQVISLSEYSDIKITENIVVVSEFYTLDNEVQPLVIEKPKLGNWN